MTGNPTNTSGVRFFAIVVFLVAIIVFNCLQRRDRPFNADEWRANKEVRRTMIADLQQRHLLENKSVADVYALLGPDNGGYALDANGNSIDLKDRSKMQNGLARYVVGPAHLFGGDIPTSPYFDLEFHDGKLTSTRFIP
jgi:hypothetical protein